MPVQSRALPYLLSDRDTMVQSRTGSGKTGAFLLPILDRIDTSRRTCQALILVPTRELAKQVEAEAALLAGDAGVRTVAVYGGTAYGPQLDAFSRGAHLVVGTPGRVLDHLIRGNLSLDDIQMLVLDEADRMLSMGFYPDMRRVRACMPKHRVNCHLFSATFPSHVLRLSGEFLTNPITLSLSTDHVHVTDVLHVFHRIPAGDKDRCLVRVLEKENPTAAIVFCNTKRYVTFVRTVLQRFGWDADELSADLNQTQRERVLQRVRDGKLRILVATDVAARGLDIPELSHVIQYEPPDDTEAYIHRAGRTGRAGASGRAITLVSDNSMETVALRRIEKEYEIDMQERDIPSEEEVADLLSQRVTALLEADLRERKQLERERVERFLPLVRQLSEEADESVLLALLLDDYYQRSMKRSPVADDRPRREDRDGDRSRDDRGGRGGGGRGRRDDRPADRGGERRSDSVPDADRDSDREAPRAPSRDEGASDFGPRLDGESSSRGASGDSDGRRRRRRGGRGGSGRSD